MPFSTATLTFLRGLKRHNTRPWFEAHRADYETDVKQPMHALIEEMDVRLARFAPDHPAAKWLKFQSFVMGRPLSDTQAVSARLPALLEADFRLMLPLVRWINGVLGFREAEGR